MLVNLEQYYNPDALVYTYEGYEEFVNEHIRSTDGDEVADAWLNLKWKDILEKLTDGVYEYFDCNDPSIDGLRFKYSEYIDETFARELDWDFDFAHKDKDGKCYIIHPYGVCDNYEQIFEKIKRLEFYKKSKEKFVIFLCEHSKKNQPECGGWRWHKWGTYIGEQEPQCEYLYDEPEIEKVYSFRVARIVEEK